MQNEHCCTTARLRDRSPTPRELGTAQEQLPAASARTRRRRACCEANQKRLPHKTQMAEQPERTPGIIDQAKAAYEQVVCAIIRPPRTTYDERHLGPRRFEFLGRTFIREDFEVHNVKDERLVCSRWAAEQRPPMVPTLIFMHGNASAPVHKS